MGVRPGPQDPSPLRGTLGLEDLPKPGIEPGSPALQADSLPSEPPGSTLTAAKSDFHFYFFTFHCMGLAWRVPWTEKPGGLQSMG